MRKCFSLLYPISYLVFKIHQNLTEPNTANSQYGVNSFEVTIINSPYLLCTSWRLCDKINEDNTGNQLQREI